MSLQESKPNLKGVITTLPEKIKQLIDVLNQTGITDQWKHLVEQNSDLIGIIGACPNPQSLERMLISEAVALQLTAIISWLEYFKEKREL